MLVAVPQSHTWGKAVPETDHKNSCSVRARPVVMPTSKLPPLPVSTVLNGENTEGVLPKVRARDLCQDDVLLGVAIILEKFMATSDELLASSQIRATPFDGPEIPDLSIYAYLNHIMLSGLCSKECFIIALIYSDRLLKLHTDFVISRRNVHRLLLICTMVASKMLDDFYCRNMYYAVAGGLASRKINELELKLCHLLKFDLHVDSKRFRHYSNLLGDSMVGLTTLPSPIWLPDSHDFEAGKQAMGAQEAFAPCNPKALFSTPACSAHSSPVNLLGGLCHVSGQEASIWAGTGETYRSTHSLPTALFPHLAVFSSQSRPMSIPLLAQPSIDLCFRPDPLNSGYPLLTVPPYSHPSAYLFGMHPTAAYPLYQATMNS